MTALHKRKSFQRFIVGGAFISFVVLYFEVQKGPAVNESVDWSTFVFEGRAHDDPELIEFIRHRMVHPPEVPLPYNLTHPERKDFSVNGQGMHLTNIFGKKSKGFFVETGGYTGEQYSPTLYWERELNWTGIIIEPLPDYYQSIARKNRRAVILHAGISPTNTANVLTFSIEGLGSKIIHLNELARRNMPSSKYVDVPCFPMTSILAALGNPTVDLFSLDIESFELKVLRTMNLSSHDIHVFMIEFEWLPEGYEALESHVVKNGYRRYAKLYQDAIFTKKGIQF